MNTQTPQVRHPSRVEFIALIAALMSLNALAIDIMLPALPNIGETFSVLDPNDRPMVLSAYLLGIGLSTLFFGPLADRFGRRKPLMVGISIYVVAALAVNIAPSFEGLLALRLIQGMGAAAFRVVVLAVVRDKYEGRTMAEVMSLAFMVLMIVPIIAPSIGQLILLISPWQGIFVFVGISGALVGLWAFLRLPETLSKANQRPLSISGIFGGFAIVFTNRFSMLYALAGMMIFGALMGMINSSQQIFVGIYDLGSMFPIAFAGMASTMAVASFINARIVNRIGVRRIAHFALIVFTLSSGLLVVLTLVTEVPFSVYITLQSLAMFMFSWIASNMNSLSMEPLGHVAGTAASAFGFFQTIGGATIGLVISKFFNGTIMPIALGFTVLGASALCCVLIAEKGKLFGVGDETKG